MKKDATVKLTKDNEGLRIDGQLISVEVKNGIVVINNYSTGGGHSCHPNISATGSVKGIKAQGYWGKDDKTVKAGSFIYNKSIIHCSDNLDRLAHYIQETGYKLPTEFFNSEEILRWQGVTITIPKEY